MAYGGDAITKQATALFQELCDTDVDVLFTFNGTGSNIVALGSLLRSAESVICSEWAHIHVDETGAPEHMLGIKLQDVDSPDAKLKPEHIVAAADKVSPHQRLLKAITEVNNTTASVKKVEDKIELLNSKTIMRS
jgi:threonine aldolase